MKQTLVPSILTPVQIASELAYCSADRILELVADGTISAQRIKGKLYVDLDALIGCLAGTSASDTSRRSL